MALSTALGEFLADRDRDRDRAASWVVLSPRSRPLDDTRIEDSGQSARAVRGGADSLRR